MKKVFFLFLFAVILSFAFCQSLLASEKEEERRRCSAKRPFYIVGYNNLPPYSWKETTLNKSEEIKDEVLKGFGNKLLEKMLSEVGFKNIVSDGSLKIDDAFDKIKKGHRDVSFGMYYNDDPYLTYKYIYPGVIDNPITIMTRADKSGAIRGTGKLKKLKGVVSKDEPISDFIIGKMKKSYNIHFVKDSYQAFKEVIDGTSDYMFTSKYVAHANAIKYGVRHKVAIGKSALWNIQMFIILSKRSPCKGMNKKMGEILKRYKKEGVVEKLMREALSDWQEKYKNTPPTYFTDVKKSSKKE